MCRRRKKKNKPPRDEDKANFNEMNINQHQATSYIVRMILGIVIGMLIAFVSLFISFHFIYHVGSSGRTGGKVNLDKLDTPYVVCAEYSATNTNTSISDIK